MKKRLTSFLLSALCLLCLFPIPSRAYADLSAGEGAIRLITGYEGFSDTAYSLGGKWYIGYGSQIGESEYPEGISREEGVALLRNSLTALETELNSFFRSNGLQPTQAQFDALVDFSFTLGTDWLEGNSDLLKMVRGETSLSRRETARAFGVWSHSGGAVLPELAQRRLEEAALYLDGSIDKADAFTYLAVKREDNVTLSTDFAAYERGERFDAFPAMFRPGYTLAGVRDRDGTLVRLGDTVERSINGEAVWEENVYSSRFQDTVEKDWFFHYVMELREKGVINGRDESRFAPADPVTVGEALKLILLAAGHPEQPAVEGQHWAGGYAGYAGERGYLSPSLLRELDRPILRIEVARLAACALGLAQSFADSPFSDTDDGFATVLFEKGILTGSESNGETIYSPQANLTRAEISAIVWRLRNASALGISQSVTYGKKEYEIAGDVPLNRYAKAGFSGKGKAMTYSESGVTVQRGIDVSRFQAEINWKAVKRDGIDFAILRVGGRMQNSGELYEDALFESYYTGAKEAGLTVGVYFYSQAINTAEAVEEADYVLNMLRGKSIDGPVVFDWETASSSNKNARSHSVPVITVCDCAIAFCERIKSSSFTPMIYMNTHDGYVKYDVSRLTDYDIWYAGQYNGDYPRFVYDFKMWQYTDSGTLEGITGKVDMDLLFLR